VPKRKSHVFITDVLPEMAGLPKSNNPLASHVLLAVNQT
jgi:hypothetical protein